MKASSVNRGPEKANPEKAIAEKQKKLQPLRSCDTKRHSLPSLTFTLVLFVFIILFLTAGLIGAIVFTLMQLNLITIQHSHNGIVSGITILLIFSVVIGTSLVAVFGHLPLRPIRRLKSAMRKIASGDFSVRVDPGHIPELDELIRDFNLMAQELGSVEALRNDFINNFSHEFRTPIVSIRGFAKLLKNDQLTAADRNEYLETVIEESNRLVQLSTNVLMLSKLETQSVISEKTHFALDEQLRRIILLLEPAWKKKNLQVSVELQPAMHVGNEELLKQVWLNILSNAIKFTPDGGQIKVKLRRPGTVEIADTGVGMDEATLSRIFEKFYQGDTAHTMQGNGLGLSLVKRILDLSGGQVTVESKLGRGSVFRVELPDQGIGDRAPA